MSPELQTRDERTRADPGPDPLKHFRHCAYRAGELARCRQLVDGRGKSFILPYDQFVEHDCRYLEAESDAGNPRYIMQLARDGRFTGVAMHYGVSSRYWSELEGDVPLILKLNGKTAIPPQEKAFSALTASVEDAVRIGATAAGYTMYYGTPRQDVDFPQLTRVREDCERFGMPLVVWAEPRGEDIDRKGGPDTSYALESAARLAVELGATVVKSNVPKPARPDFLDNSGVPEYYRNLERELQSMPDHESLQVRVDRVVQAAQGVPVLFGGGPRIGDEDLLHHAEVCIKSGCLGLMFGRNIWMRERSKALEITQKLRTLLHEAE